MPTWQKFYSFRADVHNGIHTLSSDTLKAMLTSDIPDITADDEKADLTDLSTANGYTAGGVTLSSVTSTQTSGTYVFKCADITWTASGGGIGPFRSVVIYNDTSTGDKLIACLTYDIGITIPDGETFTVDVNETTGIFYSA